MSGTSRKGLVPLILGVLAVIAIVVGTRLYLYPPREPIGPPDGEFPTRVEGGAEPVTGHLVGHLRSHILQRFGPPSHQCAGHYGNPPFEYRRRFWGAVTWTYDRPPGTLYISFVPQGEDWVCFSSDWLPRGVVF